MKKQIAEGYLEYEPNYANRKIIQNYIYIIKREREQYIADLR